MGSGRRSRSRSKDRNHKKSTDKTSSSKASNGPSSKRDRSREEASRDSRAPVSSSSGTRDDNKHNRDSEGRGGRDCSGGGDRESSSSRAREHGSRKSSRSRSRERDRDRKKDHRERAGRKGESSSSSRRVDDKDRDHRNRYHHDRDSGGRKDRKDRDRDRDRERRGERDRKRSRGSGGNGSRHGRRGKYDSDSDDGGGRGGNPDDKWKQKLRNEDEQLLNIDPDELMLDEEEEERRLEEERRRRKEKLEALQRKSMEAEKAKKAAEAAGASGTTVGGETAAAEEAGDQSASGNDGRITTGPGENSSMATNGNNMEGDDSADDDAGPIEITKQGSDRPLTTNGTGNGQDEEEDDDLSGAQNDALAAIPGAGRPRKPAESGAVNEGKGKDAGESSSEVRAKQGKEDRPVFDMFSAVSLTAGDGVAGPKIGVKGPGGHDMSYLGDDAGGDQGNWTDVEGYYKTRVGEVIGGRYTVLGTVGQGVFSTVLKCLDTRAGPGTLGGTSEVALKMIRNNDTMRKAAQKEVALLKELAEHDPNNRKHCIRMLCSLEHKQHTVMVFESMQMNLRETLKKFGRKTGINIHAVQKYAKQLMAALKHMASRRLVHADIKPDNILVDQGFGSLKLADFGSAFRETDPDNDPTPYLVSRWYRAPEIVLGLEYDKAIDLWSVAVTLYELYKGTPVLPGANNNEMLKRMMDMKGALPQRMIKTHIRAFETMGTGIRPHFTERGEFMQQEPDPVSGEPKVRLVTVTGPAKPIKSDIMRSKGAQDSKETVGNLADFLDKCMSLDPRQRMSLEQCSAHSFLRR